MCMRLAEFVKNRVDLKHRRNFVDTLYTSGSVERLSVRQACQRPVKFLGWNFGSISLVNNEVEKMW
jgi:hypothetical protein